MPSADLPTLDQLPGNSDLPDPLGGSAGAGAITTPTEWVARRQRLLTLLRHYEYGVPPAPVAFNRRVRFRDDGAFGGAGTLAEVDLNIGSAPKPIRVLVALPSGSAEGPVRRPVFVGVNFTGNHTLIDDERIAVPDQLPHSYQAATLERGAAPQAFPLADITAAGCAVATFYAGDLDLDDPDVRDGGIRPWFDDLPGLDPAAPPGSLTAWAWGLSRVVDYLLQQPTIAAQSVVAVGHSRFGKVAMLAGATDARIDAVIAHQAGAGGTSPLRSTDPGAEKPSHLVASFPHWFTPAFTTLADEPDRAPFDQHSLLALAAPRPVLLSNAVEDAWADPVGQLAVRAAAEPVYALADPAYEPFEQPTADAVPAPGTHLRGRVEWSLREGGHSVTAEDWQGFLDFVQRQVTPDSMQ
jgi:hypothetical protein